MKLTDKIEITNEDNMLLMARYPDNYFDLAIVDPPYGIGADKHHLIPTGGKAVAPKKQYHSGDWDKSAPKDEYFIELFRVSKNVIIWGANHFINKIPFDSPCWIVWDKINGENNFADCELAWTSFNTSVRQFRFKWQGMLQGDMKNKETRIHPTQKPVALYKWLLDKYAKENDKILDTHLGSGSIAIACHDYGFELTACELDSEYYEKAIERIKNHVAQQKLF
jgi:site-specific DNA-methyltransferase (adenine-specific)